VNYYSRYYRSISKGQKRQPRGFSVSQRINQVLSIDACTTFRRERDNPAIGFIEGLQFVAGYFDVDQIAAVAPHARLDLFTAQSAYGPRVSGQLAAVVDELSGDKDTRRAVLIIANQHELLSDRPCTTCIQFHTVKTRFGMMLDATVTMRSSDAVWGLPYDLIQFGLMHAVVGHCTHLALGKITLNLGNAHIYEMSAVPNNWTTWKFTVQSEADTVEEWKELAVQYARLSAKELYVKFNFRSCGE